MLQFTIKKGRQLFFVGNKEQLESLLYYNLGLVDFANIVNEGNYMEYLPNNWELKEKADS